MSFLRFNYLKDIGSVKLESQDQERREESEEKIQFVLFTIRIFFYSVIV